MGQSRGHASLAGTINTILLQRLITSATDAATGMDEKDVKQIFPLFSGKIHQKGKLWYEPDGSFGFFGRNEKGQVYITAGGLLLGLIIDANYPRLNKARVGLIVADDNSLGFRWERRGDVFYSDRQGPVDGEVGFYLSDFFGAAGLLAAYCRPPVGISRQPNFTISYGELGAAFRIARHLNFPKKFTMTEGDEKMLLEAMQGPSSILKHVKRQDCQELAQDRQEFERTLAKERQEFAQDRQEFERTLAKEREQNLAKMHQQHATGMGSTGRARGGSSSSKPDGSGRRFFTTVPRAMLNGSNAFLSWPLTSGRWRTEGYLGPSATAKPYEVAIASWRRLLTRFPRKW
ncbi:hypothetical protein B0T25DRAFT_576290 [Lasiosphaeria hispida]|uniref:Uncharacterized protein n=1 Tax=Lasiosphaeria hispida TaxID=260671 RepID=A0AAJ0HW11_9PEZI|nr:hypothetical protein B0T25DRAFT_576290 [Lasiosphaeria hispida]